MKGHLRPRDRRKTLGSKRPCRHWQLVVDAMRDTDGKRNQRYRSFEGSKTEAEGALRKFIAEIETGFASNGDGLTVAGYMDRWLEHASLECVRVASFRTVSSLACTLSRT